MKKVNYKVSKKKTGKRFLGKVTRSKKDSLAYVTGNGDVYEVDRNTKGRPKGAKNKKGKGKGRK